MSDYKISIRSATSADVEAVLKCLREAFEEYRDRYTPEAFLDTVLTPETLHARMAAMSVFVAATGSGAVVGTIACQAVNADEAHIRGMAVHPEWQGAGVASHLLRHAVSQLREWKCSRISLDTTAPLKRAMVFYERHGFRRSGKVTDFFGMELFEYTLEVP